MTDLFGRFIDFVAKNHLFRSHEHVLVAVSGGADSVVLLDLLRRSVREFDLKLEVVHLNHGIRGKESDEDETFVRNLALELELSFHVKKVNAPEFARNKGYSLEEAARVLRFRFFEEILKETNAHKIALAHHADDQVETIILNFLRGSGPVGLSGMKPERDKFIRPLLFATRAEIEEYARTRNLKFRTDSSNLDISYKRNRIRHELLPYLRNHFTQGIDRSLLRTQKIMAEVDDFLRQQAKEAILKCVRESKKDKIILEINTFLSYFIIIQKYMIYSLLEQFEVERFSVSSEKIDRIIRLIQNRKNGRREIVTSDVQILIDRSSIVFQKGKVEDFEIEIEPGQSYALPDGRSELRLTLLPRQDAGGIFSDSRAVEFVDWEKISGQLRLRSIRPGDRFFPLNFTGQKKVSDFLTDLKVPLHRREEIPVLECDSGIIWIVGYRLDDRFKVTPKTTQLLKLEKTTNFD